MKTPQLGCVDSQMLLAQQREGAGAPQVTFKMTATKTPQVKKTDISMRLQHLFKSVR